MSLPHRQVSGSVDMWAHSINYYAQYDTLDFGYMHSIGGVYSTNLTTIHAQQNEQKDNSYTRICNYFSEAIVYNPCITLNVTLPGGFHVR